MQRHVGDVGLERLADALADELDQGVELELRRERLADAVHGGQLGHALARLVDSRALSSATLRLPGERRQEPLVVLAEGVLRSRFWSEITPVARPPTTSG